jgi:SAM-dependent methyltransferase
VSREQAKRPHTAQAVSPSVLRSLDRIPPSGRALDVAMGRGRHALELAARGFQVLGLDTDSEAMAEASALAAQRGLTLETRVLDLEAPRVRLPAAGFDLVLVVNFLWRPLLTALRQAVRPGGHLLYETFTREHARYGRPRNPDILLEPGELLRAFHGFEVLESWEGLVPGPAVRAHLLARRPHRVPSVTDA